MAEQATDPVSKEADDLLAVIETAELQLNITARRVPSGLPRLREWVGSVEKRLTALEKANA